MWYARFPFEEDASQGKIRPVLILSVEKERVTVVAMKITSTEPRLPYDFQLQDWSDIPLDHESTIQPSRVARIAMHQLKSYAGDVSDADWEEALKRFKEYRDSL